MTTERVISEAGVATSFAFVKSVDRVIRVVSQPLRVAFPVGTEVGAKRWPYSGAHPDAWGRPWKGVVIAHDDPRAWADTLASPGRVPTIEEARAHVADITARGFDTTRTIPVLWDFGSGEEKAYFETPDQLRPYAEDVAAWEEARARCLDGYREKAGV